MNTDSFLWWAETENEETIRTCTVIAIIISPLSNRKLFILIITMGFSLRIHNIYNIEGFIFIDSLFFLLMKTFYFDVQWISEVGWNTLINVNLCIVNMFVNIQPKTIWLIWNALRNRFQCMTLFNMCIDE